MRKAQIIAIAVCVILVTVFIAGSLTIRIVATKALPDYNAKLSLPGLKNRVIIYRDAHAIPHVYAKNEPDLYRAVGYCMAQDRMWQMDLLRRLCEGRLAEIFGEELVQADLLMRALRIPDKSRLMLSRIDSSMKAGLQAYCDGVNQYLRDYKDKLPPEFKILRYKPEKWRPEHSAHLVSFMAWNLAFGWQSEVLLHKVRKKVGEARFKDLLPDVAAQTTVIYPDFKDKISELDMRSDLLAACKVLQDLGLTVFHGSNNWAISGKKSTTDMPILANDMHLILSAPCIWYRMHQVVDGKLNVTGVVLSGTPIVTAGHNENIAWGFTNVMVDDVDFYLEKVNPKNPKQYRFKDEWKDFTVSNQKIKVRGGETIEKVLKFTHRGPVISEFQKVRDEVISMRWTGNEYSNELKAIYLLNRAKNWDEFKQAIRDMKSVSQNVVYADIDGNIGLYCAAGVPIRKAGDGILVVPGWTGEYEWESFVPFEKLPHSYNPDRGYVVTANNKTVGNDYPYYISLWFVPPHRFERLDEMLSAKKKLSIEDFKRIQTDFKSKLVEEMKGDIAGSVKKITNLTDTEKKALDMLSSWNGVISKSSSAASIFDTFYVALGKNLLADEMGKELFDEYYSKFFLPRHSIDNIWKHKDSAWWDDVTTKKKETFTDIVQKSFRDAVKTLQDTYGGPKDWQWGKMHKLSLNHPMGVVKLLDMLFKLNRGPYEVGGSFHTACPYSYMLDKPYEVNLGASQRHIYSLAKWDDGLSVLPTGISGIPASDFYCDQARFYTDKKYLNDYFSKELVEKNAKFKTVLEPRK